MELLERDPLLATLGGHLREAAAGRGALVFLGGEAGIGKTALVTHFAASARRTVRVFGGACDPLSTPRPLGPLADISNTLPGETARLLLANAPRGQIFRAFLAALTDGVAPTVVIVEDLHWADEATLDLIGFLGRRISDARLLILATYRDDEIGATHPLRIALGDLATTATVHRLTLPPLSVEAVRTLARESPLDPLELHRQTGGNAFFVAEVLAVGEHRLPATVRDVVLGRAARLSPAGRATLEVAAVIGTRVEPWLLIEVAGAALESGGDAIGTGVLHAENGILAFRHELAREAVLGDIAPPRLLALHRTILAALRAAPAGVATAARLAHHAEAAGDRAAILTYAARAAREAARLSAHREAAAQYARALRVVNEPDPPHRARLLLEYSRECQLIGQHDEAIRACQEAIALWHSAGERLREGESLSRLASQLVVSGRNPEAEAASRAALALLEVLPPGPELAAAYRTHAHLRMLDRDTAAAVKWGEQAIALAERVQARETLIGAFNTVGAALLVADDLAGLAYLERSAVLAREAGSEEYVALAALNLGSALGEHYHFALATRYLEQGIAYCVAHDLDYHRLYMLAWLALCRMYQGRWTEAAGHATLVAWHPASAPISRIMALVALGRIRARRGDPEVAPLLDEALALARQTGALQRLAPVHAARAEAAALANDLARIRAEAYAVSDLAARQKHPWFTSEFGYWLWRAAAGVAVPATAGNPFALQIVGDWPSAAAQWDALGCPYEAARARAEADDETALRQALAAFEQLGARPMVRAVARRLRERGARAIPRGPRPTTRANVGGLTRREIEIVALLADNLRNAEIATRLSLAPKTVEHHISSILAKLGARNRAEAMRAAAQLAILPQPGGDTTPK